VDSPGYISLLGAAEAMKMLLHFGIENIEKRILKLTDYLIEQLKNLDVKIETPEERQYRSGIVLAKLDKPREACEALAKKDIVVSARANGLRISPHFYNTEAEIDRLIEEIKKVQIS